jgi:hypothetical protein
MRGFPRVIEIGICTLRSFWTKTKSLYDHTRPTTRYGGLIHTLGYPLISAPDDGLHDKREFEAVERISQALFQLIDLDEVVETTLRIAIEEVGAEAGSILLANPEKEELIFQYSIGEKPVPPWNCHSLG